MSKKTKQNKHNDSCPLVAMDIGGSSIKAIAAEKLDNGAFRILGLERLSKQGYIDKGIITQTTDAGFCIGRILTQLTNRIGISDIIDRAFVTIGGRLLQMALVTVKRDLVSRNYISDKLLDSMRKECQEKLERSYPQLAVLTIEATRYLLDGVEQDYKPTNKQKTRYFEIVFTVFVGKREAKENILGSFNRANKSIEYQWVRPEAHITALTTQDEQLNGVAIVDLGAQTTTLTIFSRDNYLHTHVIPLGGDDITKQLQGDSLSFEIAEKVKTNFGCALKELIREDKNLRIPSSKQASGYVVYSLSQIAEIIESVLDEILGPVMQEINHFADKTTKIYLTGGGALLKGILQYTQRQTTISVEYGSHAEWLETDAADEYFDPSLSALIGTLALGEEHRKEGNANFSDPPFTKRFVDTLIDLFSDPNTEQ